MSWWRDMEGYGVYLTHRQLDEAIDQSYGCPTKLIRNLLTAFFSPSTLAVSNCYGIWRYPALNKDIIGACSISTIRSINFCGLRQIHENRENFVPQKFLAIRYMFTFMWKSELSILSFNTHLSYNVMLFLVQSGGYLLLVLTMHEQLMDYVYFPGKRQAYMSVQCSLARSCKFHNFWHCRDHWLHLPWWTEKINVNLCPHTFVYVSNKICD